jgi:hypothetical protein
MASNEEFLKTLFRPSVKRLRALRMEPIMLPLRAANRLRRSSLLHCGGPVVSLTTYGKRIGTVYLTIESIARGDCLPSRVILWLDDELLFYNLPVTLQTLQKRGLEIKLCKNYGPHKKYYPYVESLESFEVPLVTADDDALYSRSWLRKLVRSFQEFPDSVNCHLAKVVRLENGKIQPYMTWQVCQAEKPSFRNIAHGVGGVMYPPQFLTILKTAGNSFESQCPRNDDLWLHVQAIRNGIKVKQVRSRARRFPLIPGTQATGLYHENYAGGNDRQIQATYAEEDVRKLLTEQS